MDLAGPGLVLILLVGVALLFDFLNGLHDAANSIATIVSTRVLPARYAVIWAAFFNFIAFLFFGQHVAATVGKGIIDTSIVSDAVIFGALGGAITWNIVTWLVGIPSSSSHALIGGLCGAAMVSAGINAVHWKGIVEKVLIPLVGSPVLGFLLGFVLMLIIYLLFGRSQPGKVGSVFRPMQMLSSAAMAFTHGQNDAQKSMGIITLALVSAGILKQPHVPLWVILACATAMALGTSAGGWRIIRTMGHRIIRLEPVHGFAAETSAAGATADGSAGAAGALTVHTSGPAGEESGPESISIGSPEESDRDEVSEDVSASTSMGSGRCPVSATRYS